jgi:nicotinamide-nucleotide amidase
LTVGALRRAEIIAVGSELLGADRTDTNSLVITQGLNDLGIDVVAKAIVGDRFDDLAGVFRDALGRADLVILTGGLGPTDDDVTRDAVARVVGRTLHEDAATVDGLRQRFANRGLAMPESNRRQALVIDGAALVSNGQGTAPGQWFEWDGRVVVLLPGPPREMRPMFEYIAREVVAPRTAGEQVIRRSLRLVGKSESLFDEMLQPLYRKWAAGRPVIEPTILAASGMIELQLHASTRELREAEDALAAAAEDVAAILELDVISQSGRPLESVLGDLLRSRRLRLGVAESCTGGLVTSRLTDVPGSSDYVERGVVAYSNRAKTELLGVPEELIAAHGAVSEAVAVAMAEGIRRMSGLDVGLAVTGIAGPGGGTEAKPVGTVAIAVEGPDRARFARLFRFTGSRDMIKIFASTTALDCLRRTILRA